MAAEDMMPSQPPPAGRDPGSADPGRADPAGPGDGPQPDRVSAAGIAISGAVLLAGILIVSWLLWFSLGALGGVRKPVAASILMPPAEDSTWFMDSSLRAGAAFPRLQIHPTEDLKSLRAREDSVLTGYGWTDSLAGKVRIPVDRAMEILAARHLTVRMGPDTLPAFRSGPGGQSPP
jgi:hypothetical protein